MDKKAGPAGRLSIEIVAEIADLQRKLERAQRRTERWRKIKSLFRRSHGP